MKNIFYGILFLLFIDTLFIYGCSESTTNIQNSETPPLPSIEVLATFPDGAPRLNSTGEFNVMVKTHNIPAKGIRITINLPDSIELTEGVQSWTGDIPIDSEIVVISAIVKPIEVGNWVIDVESYIDPGEHGYFGGIGHHPVYILVADTYTEWGLTPPWSENITPVIPTIGE